VTYLVDTSLLLRLANPSDQQYAVADNALSRLENQGERLHIAPQNLVEFRNGATRPVEVNGLGLSASVAEAQAEEFEKKFTLLSETPEIYLAWKTLVEAAGVIGKQVHDARLVAICQVYGVSHILTFNVRHFARLALFEPGITIVDPASILF
jgi:predicted nucleic acid-binding protein